MTAATEDIPTPSWLDPEVFPFRNRGIRVHGHLIHYIDEGKGPVLLLLHGNGSWSFGFRLVVPLLSAHFRVVALDYPGFGLSIAADGYSFKPEDHTQVVEAFVDALELRDVRLFVEDWGGPIGLGLAGRRPELFHSLFIVNTWAWPAQGYPNLERFSMLAGSFFGRFMITRFNMLERLLLSSLSTSRQMSLSEKRGYYMPYPTAQSRLPQAVLPRQILASQVYLQEVENGLEKLAKKRVLIIWGEKDGAFTETQRKKFQDRFAHASVVLLPDAKHFVHIDEPNLTAEAIIAFESGRGGEELAE